eukprot:GEMP01029071.1.p2 GENE.GEMP01029071.1~~GEMP01029071.1.p2  ORF type:complete len:241 (+),score=45.11 GEMP01029071.1:1203-1925(+)
MIGRRPVFRPAVRGIQDAHAPEVRFPRSFWIEENEVIMWFQDLKTTLTGIDATKVPPVETCLMVPSGDHASPSWKVSSVLSVSDFNPLLVIAGSQMFLRSLVKLCFGQAWWIRLIWMLKLLTSLSYKERIRELAGFIVWTWRRATRPWEGVYLRSLAGEIKGAQLCAPRLPAEIANHLLDLPTLYVDQGEDFRKNFKVLPPNPDATDMALASVAEEHIYPIKEFHALPEEWKASTYKWFT